jgi:hypothetical protein
MRFSLFSSIPNTCIIARDYDQQELKTKYIPNLKRELEPGWLKPYLFHIDGMLYGRWEYWMRLQIVPTEKYHLLQEPNPDKRLENIQNQILLQEPIPPITFGEGYVSSHDKGRKMLDICLDKMLTQGGYVNVMTRVEYLLDWLLYGFGHPHPWFRELPPEPHSCDGCSMVLYQLFDLFPLLYRPKDYFGVLIAESKGKGSQKHTGYFPTPGSVANMIGKMLFCDRLDTRLQKGCEPAIGTGVMTLEPSNQVLSMIGVDIDKLVLKACLVNWYLYCPWFAEPIFYLADRTDLLWGNTLVGKDHPQAPQSIHQKYWLEQYQDICSFALKERDWLTEIQKIVDSQPSKVAAPEFSAPKIDESSKGFGQNPKSPKSKNYRRPKSKKKFDNGLWE